MSEDRPQLGVPVVLRSMIEYLSAHSLTTPGLFIESGDPELLQTIQDYLDDGGPLLNRLPPSDTASYSVAETLLRFLDVLPEPVISNDFCKGYISSCSAISEEVDAIVEALPEPNRIVYHYLQRFICDCLLPRNSGVTGPELANVFAKVLTRVEVGLDQAKVLMFLTASFTSKAPARDNSNT
jgi:hypothetical protein